MKPAGTGIYDTSWQVLSYVLQIIGMVFNFACLPAFLEDLIEQFVSDIRDTLYSLNCIEGDFDESLQKCSVPCVVAHFFKVFCMKAFTAAVMGI